MDEMFYSLEIDGDAERDLNGNVIKRTCGALGITRTSISNVRVRRTTRSIAYDPVEEFCFMFPLAGTTMHRQRGIEAVAERGTMCFLNASEPHEVVHGNATEVICLTMPCDLLRARIPHIDDERLRPGVATSLVGSTLMQLLGGALSHDVRACSERMEALCVDMLHLMLPAAAPRYA